MKAAFRAFLEAVFARFLGNPLVRRVIRNTGYLFSAQTLSMAMSFLQGVLTARLLGVEGAGYVGVITQFSSNINRLTSFRMSELVVNYLGEFTTKNREQHAAAVFKAAALVEIGGSLVAFILVVALSPLGADIFAKNPALAGLFAFYGLSVLANLIYESATGLLHFFNRFRLVAAIMIGQSLLTLIMIAFAYSNGAGIEAVIQAYLAGKIVLAVGVSLAAFWQAGRVWGADWWRAPLSLLKDYRKELVRFGISTNISGTLKLVTRDSEMLWLGAFSTPLQVGYYKIARAIMNILMMPITPLVTTSYREIAREVAARSWENVRYLLRSGSLLAAAYSLPASLGLIFFGRVVVGIYGADFLPDSYFNILILLAGVIPVNVFYWNQLVLLPLGLPQFPTQVLFVAAVLKILGTFWLVSRWGSYGMAVLLSGFFLFTTAVLVWRTLLELRRVERKPALAMGD